MKVPDIIEVALEVIRVFEDLKIPYYIGGSLASSAFGVARSTMDVDIVADIKAEHASLLKERLEAGFYIDQEMIEKAIRSQSSFNLVHLETMFKIDVFISTDQPFDKTALSRRRPQLAMPESDRRIYFSSPEDIILRKLMWFSAGEEVADRQWGDALGVIKVQGESLDLEYLRLWADKLGVFELLKKAFREAGVKMQ